MTSAERGEEDDGSEGRDAAAAPRRGVASFLPGRVPKEVSEGDAGARSNSNNNRQNVPFPVNGVADRRVSNIQQVGI